MMIVTVYMYDVYVCADAQETEVLFGPLYYTITICIPNTI